MTTKASIIMSTIIITTLLGCGQIAAVIATTGFIGDDFTGVKSDRPAINADFAPDESCWFDVMQLKCIPGSQQDCPEGFEINEDRICHPTGPCPDGYHSAWEDESGQCYPNDEGCQDDGFYLAELEDEDRSDQCGPLYTICDEEEVRNGDFCIEYCEKHPEELACKPNAN